MANVNKTTTVLEPEKIVPAVVETTYTVELSENEAIALYLVAARTTFTGYKKGGYDSTHLTPFGNLYEELKMVLPNVDWHGNDFWFDGDFRVQFKSNNLVALINGEETSNG